MYKATKHINTVPTVELPAPVTKDEMTAYINITMEYNYNCDSLLMITLAKVDTFKGLSLFV